jgi:diguanylate cyclase (GGDEF)-like protein/PAS domain S-box-containing protein
METNTARDKAAARLFGGLGVVLAAQLRIKRAFAAARQAGSSLRQANAVLESRLQERTAEVTRLTRLNEQASGDCEELRSVLEQHRGAHERFRFADAVFRNTQEGIAVTDLDGNIVAVNPAFSTITEYSDAELVGQHIRLLQSGRQDSDFYQRMWECILATGSWQGEVWDRRKSGEIYQQWVSISTVRDDAGELTHYVGVFTDISRMKHAKSHLEYLAHHDALTGLPNRSLLYARLRHTVERARRDRSVCAVLLVDLDRFKTVNDSLGHEAGDEVLQLAGSRMRQRLRDSDTLARLGGDEFAVVLEQLAAPGNAEQIAQTLVEQLSIPFTLASGKEICIGGSAGISLFPANGDGAESLIRSADTALYQAKAAGRGTWRFDGVKS